MASESSSEGSGSISLPSELDEWLGEQAAALGIGREQLLVQLLAAYRTASELDDDVAILSGEDLERRVQSQLGETVEEALSEQISEATSSVQRQLTNRIDTVEAEFDGKISDVRERVIQVKKEADRKAPADHSHEELEELETLAAQLEEMRADLDDLRAEFDEHVPEHEQTLADLDTRLETLQERMQTVAWVVSDLRDAYESTGGLETVERIKRAAAKENIEHAKCENCGDSVAIALLTDPTCPHCDATVSNVEPSSGWFGSPKLLTASQLESGHQQ